MPKPEKIDTVEATKASAEKANSIVLTDFTGLNVERDVALRRKLRDESIEYKVIKNRLAKISFQESDLNELVDYLSGPTAIAFGYDDPGAPVRIIFDEGKKTNIPKIKAIFFEGRLFTAEEAQKIVDLPSRDELVAKFVGGLNAPLANFVGGLQGLLQKFVGTLQAIQNEKEKESE